MSSYLFGSLTRGRAIGSINNIPVSMETRNGEVIVTIGQETKTFQYRKDALNYLRKLAEQAEQGKSG